MWRLERRAMVHVADEYSCGDDRLEVGGITDPPMAEQVAALTPDQLRGLCIAYARVAAHGTVEQHRVDRGDEEAVFMAISDYRDGEHDHPDSTSATAPTMRWARTKPHRIPAGSSPSAANT
ncbi:MAG TPA: hypothetical protein VLZ05_17700 [Mycobacterium sp.]|jgi:hypothetical protein|nr:hypothetical protein [Mycobacterium sp.]